MAEDKQKGTGADSAKESASERHERVQREHALRISGIYDRIQKPPKGGGKPPEKPKGK